VSYTYVIERSAAEFVLSRPPREQRLLGTIFQELARRPGQPPDFVEIGPNGRELLTRFAGPYSITYWVDHAVAEVRIALVRLD
jgi:hypothetical protein